jgi:hypothetical protein
MSAQTDIFWATLKQVTWIMFYMALLVKYYAASKSKMISRRLGGGDEAYCAYVEEADDEVNKDSALI